MSPQYASYGSSEWFTSPPHYFYLFLTLQPRGSAAAGWLFPLHASTPPPLLKIHTHNAHVRVRILDDTDADLVRVNLRQSPFYSSPRVRPISQHGVLPPTQAPLTVSATPPASGVLASGQLLGLSFQATVIW